MGWILEAMEYKRKNKHKFQCKICFYEKHSIIVFKQTSSSKSCYSKYLSITLNIYMQIRSQICEVYVFSKGFEATSRNIREISGWSNCREVRSESKQEEENKVNYSHWLIKVHIIHVNTVLNNNYIWAAYLILNFQEGNNRET